MKRKNLMFIEPAGEDATGGGPVPEPSAQAEPDGGQVEPTPPADGSDSEAEKVEDLPQWAQDHISTLRKEAAARRTSANELTQKLAVAKSPEEYQAAVDELTAATAKVERELHVERAQRITGLPDALAARLQGNTYEELLADAKVLAAFNAASTPNPLNASGGLTPNQGSPEPAFDPYKQAAKSNKRRR